MRETTLHPRTEHRAGIGKQALNLGRLAGFALLCVPLQASASFLSGEALDTAADWVAIFVLVIVPIVVIVLFWLVHILPEKIAEKKEHPQKDAIKTLCLLSLVFGGMLWPLAWLWAYTRPVGYKLAYGTEKHEDHYVEMSEKAREGHLSAEDIAHLQHELDAIAAKGALPAKLRGLRDELAALAAAAPQKKEA